MEKIQVILFIFIAVFLILFLFLLNKILKNNKKERFEEEETKKTEDKEDNTDNEESGKKETYADKLLDKNLFIINTFEELHSRKITTEELKKFSQMFSDDKITKSEMKDKIQNYKNEQFQANESNMDELLEVSKKLTSIIEKMSKKENVVEKFENFKGVMPFSNEKNYVLLR
jgi:hypothetical protein